MRVYATVQCVNYSCVAERLQRSKNRSHTMAHICCCRLVALEQLFPWHCPFKGRDMQYVTRPWEGDIVGWTLVFRRRAIRHYISLRLINLGENSLCRQMEWRDQRPLFCCVRSSWPYQLKTRYFTITKLVLGQSLTHPQIGHWWLVVGTLSAVARQSAHRW